MYNFKVGQLLSSRRWAAAQSWVGSCATCVSSLGLARCSCLQPQRVEEPYGHPVFAGCISIKCPSPARRAHPRCDDLERRMEAILFACNPCVYSIPCREQPGANFGM